MPAVHPHVQVELFSHLGAIFSHGFMPVRLGFPTVASLVLGTSVGIPELMLITSFQDYLSCHD